MATYNILIPREELPKCKYCHEAMHEIDTHYVQHIDGVYQDVMYFICRKCTKTYLNNKLARTKVVRDQQSRDLVVIKINSPCCLADLQ